MSTTRSPTPSITSSPPSRMMVPAKRPDTKELPRLSGIQTQSTRLPIISIVSIQPLPSGARAFHLCKFTSPEALMVTKPSSNFFRQTGTRCATTNFSRGRARRCSSRKDLPGEVLDVRCWSCDGYTSVHFFFLPLSLFNLFSPQYLQEVVRKKKKSPRTKM